MLAYIVSATNCNYSFRMDRFELTAITESRAARDKISAQETTEGQAASTNVFIESITSKPLSESLFGIAVFSPVKFDVSSNSTDASHPYMNIYNHFINNT